jgi:segregation and condensation protein A
MGTLPASDASDQRAAARVELGQFSGPLDLLLHLVRTGELDITGLPVAEVVRQCDEYLRLIEAIDLESAGDHLVMAATLVHMKSRRLLPPDPLAEPEIEAALEVVPGRLAGAIEELRRAAEQLQEREAAMELVFRRPSDRVRAGERVPGDPQADRD